MRQKDSPSRSESNTGRTCSAVIPDGLPAALRFALLKFLNNLSFSRSTKLSWLMSDHLTKGPLAPRVTQQLESGIIARCWRVTFESLSGCREITHLNQLVGPLGSRVGTIGNNSSSALHLRLNSCHGAVKVLNQENFHPPWLNEANLSNILLFGTNPPRTSSCKNILGNNTNNFHALHLLTSSPTSVPAFPLAQCDPHCRSVRSSQELGGGGDFVTCARVLNITRSTPSRQTNSARRVLVT